MSRTCGYLYIATKDRVEEAIRSARSLKAVDRESSITLIADGVVHADVFDNILYRPWEIGQNDWHSKLLYKVRHMYVDSPYERTFFLDTDTYVVENGRPLFKLLDYFDLCISRAPGDLRIPRIDGLPLEGCQPPNTGVILFRRSRENDLLFQIWRKSYEIKLRNKDFHHRDDSDQICFLDGILASQARIHWLPNLWNARTWFFQSFKGPVKIIHEKNVDFKNLEKLVNVTSRQRGWDPLRRQCYLRNENFFSKTKRKLKSFIRVNRKQG
ncbi:MAG: hypothetical protein JW893_08110 [Candidatus Omnitrophica bacterium]|nr:hypothetical protein [Candidatus Omnitrophota bacterium]